MLGRIIRLKVLFGTGSMSHQVSIRDVDVWIGPSAGVIVAFGACITSMPHPQRGDGNVLIPLEIA